jgi:hypothetical protein
VKPLPCACCGKEPQVSILYCWTITCPNYDGPGDRRIAWDIKYEAAVEDWNQTQRDWE